MEYQKQHIPPSPQKRPQIKLLHPAYITIHSTGCAWSTAQDERDYLTETCNRQMASFHIVVDDKMAIECIPPSEVAWHANDGRGDGNMRSLSLMICESGDRAQTLRNAALITAKILYENHWHPDRVVQHSRWTKKNCPRILKPPKLWQNWLQQVQTELDQLPETTIAIKK